MNTITLQKSPVKTKTIPEIIEKQIPSKQAQRKDVRPQDGALQLFNHTQSFIIFGDASFKSDLKQELQNSNIRVKCVDATETIDQHIDGSEAGIIVLGETQNNSMNELLAELEIVGQRFNIPIVSVLPEYTPIGMEQRYYKQGIQMIFEWPREQNLILDLIMGLHIAGPLKTKSQDIDSSLEMAVKNRMRANRSLFRGYVMPTIYNGVLMLCGSVESVWKKRKIKEAAELIPGVKGASVSSIKVRPAVRLGDLALQNIVRNTLDSSSQSGAGTLDVVVKNGEAKLAGTLPSLQEAKSLEKEVSKTKGLKAVSSNFDVNPSLHQADKKLWQKVRIKVRKIYPNMKNIRITVHHGQAVIRGVVKSMFKVIQLENAIITTPRIRKVENNLRVKVSS